MKTLSSLFLGLFLVLPPAGCGTIFFAQRQKAPHSERMDPNILILDAVGLLFWVFPGLIAYGIDFYTGAIYLPPDVMKGEGPFIKDKPGEAKPEEPKPEEPKAEEPKAEEPKPEEPKPEEPKPEEPKPEEPKPEEPKPEDPKG